MHHVLPQKMVGKYFHDILDGLKVFPNTKVIERTLMRDHTTSETDSMVAQSKKRKFFELIPILRGVHQDSILEHF